MIDGDGRQDAVKSDRPPTNRTAAGEAFSLLVVRILRLNGLLAAAGDALARPAGQTTARWQVLAMLEEGSHTVSETARTLGLARQSVQRVADLLESEGLVAYEENPRHRRARLLRLTMLGRSTLGEIQAAQRPWADGLGGTLGEARLRRLNADLERVLDALAGRARRGPTR
ncbi:MAG TPA: MarR family winged helix-turn-helix transcriptional regulator [Candidatus Limnocylindrales bacterium]|jgi:DNA-binding MarR family transcriptional regulator